MVKKWLTVAENCAIVNYKIKNEGNHVYYQIKETTFVPAQSQISQPGDPNLKEEGA